MILVVEMNGQLNFSNGNKERIAHTGEFGMGVHKGYRGLGIGRLLLESLIQWCRKNETIEKISDNEARVTFEITDLEGLTHLSSSEEITSREVELGVVTEIL